MHLFCKTDLYVWLWSNSPANAFLIVALQLYIIYVVSAKNCVRKYDKKFSKTLVSVLLLTVIQVILGTSVREFIDTVEKSGAPKSLWLQYPKITFYIHRSFSIVVLLANLFLLLRNRNLQLGFEKEGIDIPLQSVEFIKFGQNTNNSQNYQINLICP